MNNGINTKNNFAYLNQKKKKKNHIGTSEVLRRQISQQTKFQYISCEQDLVHMFLMNIVDKYGQNLCLKL